MKYIGELLVSDNVQDITGKRFGLLTAIKPVRLHKSKRTMIWLWQCDCGKQFERFLGGVTRRPRSRNTVPSCGCERVRKLKEQIAKPPGASAFNILFSAYKQKARERNLDFRLSEDEFRIITKQNCYYCGKPPLQEFTRKGMNGSYFYNGIDRLNNSLGYYIENCVPCCGVCNMAKNKLNSEDFLKMVESIYNNRFAKCQQV